MSKTYEYTADNEWIYPKHRGFRLMCCDCELVHDFDFKIDKDQVAFRVKRNARATAAARRKKKRAAR